MSKIKAVFVDRDGTINIDKNYVYRIEDFELIPGSIEALKVLTQYGIKIYIITNQAGIAKGLYTEKQYHILTEYTLNVFKKEGIKIEKVLYCPHHPEGIVPEYTRNCSGVAHTRQFCRSKLWKMKISILYVLVRERKHF